MGLAISLPEGDFRTVRAQITTLDKGILCGYQHCVTPELQSALKRHMQWFGSYRKSGELVKVQVWLIVNSGRIEFLTGKDSYKVRRLRRNSRAICYVGKKNGPAVPGTAEIVSDKADLARVYQAYWKTHPVFMLLGIGLRIWIEMLLGNRVVVRVEPDQPNPLAGGSE